jgi:hypothetical protein
MRSGTNTHERIIKMFRRGLTCQSIAKKIGPGDIRRVHDALEFEKIDHMCGGERSRGPWIP